ncbi:hypothetical protein NECAME_17846, partial [Necator americanus]
MIEVEHRDVRDLTNVAAISYLKSISPKVFRQTQSAKMSLPWYTDVNNAEFFFEEVECSEVKVGVVPELLVTTANPFQRQFDTSARMGVISSSQGLGNGQNIVRTALVDQRVNTVDPSFYDCFYGIANTQATVVERCYKDIGCCQYGCCHNHDWHNKYGWAVALIVIFCILVVIAVAIWLIVWLINRAKDKRQKREI